MVEEAATGMTSRKLMEEYADPDVRDDTPEFAGQTELIRIIGEQFQKALSRVQSERRATKGVFPVQGAPEADKSLLLTQIESIWGDHIHSSIHHLDREQL